MAFKSTTRHLGSFNTKISINEPDSDEEDTDDEEINENDELDKDIDEINLDDDIDEIDLGAETTSSKLKTLNKKLPPQIKTRSFLGAEPIMTRREIVREETNNDKLVSKNKVEFADRNASSFSGSSSSKKSQGFRKETLDIDEEDEVQDTENLDLTELTKIVDRISDDLEKRLSVHPDYAKEKVNSKNDFDHIYFKSLVYDLDEFIQTPPPKDLQIQCKIVVHRAVFNEYHLYMENGSDASYYLMRAFRKKTLKQLDYTITIANINTPYKFGNLLSNISRNSYVLTGNYDEEDKMSEKKYADIKFTNKIFEGSKPKDLLAEIVIFDKKSVEKNQRDGSVHDMFHRETKSAIDVMSKKPYFDPETKTFRLNFQGRVNLPSTNNVQLVDVQNPDKVLFQIGKAKRNCYICDFSYPFCAYSAFGMAISCLSKK